MRICGDCVANLSDTRPRADMFLPLLAPKRDMRAVWDIPMFALLLGLTTTMSEPRFEQAAFLRPPTAFPDVAPLLIPKYGSEYMLPDLMFHRIDSVEKGLLA